MSYRVPTMHEIEQVPWNGYNVISTFSGGGGSCLGYRMAGYRVLYASEFVDEARNTYKANHTGVYLDPRDIRCVSVDEILSVTGLKKGDVDLFDGSPPCSAFSTAGKVQKNWGKAKKYSDNKIQTIEDLFGEYIRILDGLQPKTFVAENVSGMVKGASVGYFKHYIRKMKECGYLVTARLLNSKYLGVPQSRERLIFVGVRKDLGIEPRHPTPEKKVITVGEALDGVANDDDEVRHLIEYMKRSAQGRIVRQLPKNPPKPITGQSVTGSSYFNTVRESMVRPCSTLTASGCKLAASGAIHPLYDRKFTINELKRLTSLPDDFILTGSRDQQGERIGRMVPPLMMAKVAKTIQVEILDKIGEP